MDSEQDRLLSSHHEAFDCMKSMTQRTMSSNICQECIIEDYSDVIDSTSYCMTTKILGRAHRLRFFKDKEMHLFQLESEADFLHFNRHRDGQLVPDRMTFHIRYSKDRIVRSGKVMELECGCSIVVGNEAILHPDNEYLHQSNKLVIQFHYRHYPYARLPVPRVGVMTQADEDSYASDMLSLYEKREESADFALITLDGERVPVHKFIWVGRSDLLRHVANFSAEYMKVFCKREVLEKALRYVYTGQLDDHPFDDLIDLFNLATMFGFSSLCQSLLFALRESLNKDPTLSRAEIDACRKKLRASNQDFLKHIEDYPALREKLDLNTFCSEQNVYKRQLGTYVEDFQKNQELREERERE